MPSGPESYSRVAIAGASSLLGKELKAVLEDRHFPAAEIILLDEPEIAGTLAEAGGEATFIRALNEESFEGAQFAFFAGNAMHAEQSIPAARRSGATVIDLTGAAAKLGPTTHLIPSLSSILPPPSGPGSNGSAHFPVYSSPGAAAIISCTLACGLQEFAPQGFIILMFPPVSERGQAGVDELESQTASLLSLREIAKPVFDTQVAFNLLSSYGAECKTSLAETRARVEREIVQTLARRAPRPSIQLLQAPVFYGYAFTAFAEFETPVPAESLGASLAGLGVRIAGKDEPAPSTVSIAGENEIHISPLETDAANLAAVWIHGVADNLRLGALNAVRIAEDLLAR
jgi:aspartate-semialdehyde dehydrogenase